MRTGFISGKERHSCLFFVLIHASSPVGSDAVMPHGENVCNYTSSICVQTFALHQTPWKSMKASQRGVKIELQSKYFACQPVMGIPALFQDQHHLAQLRSQNEEVKVIIWKLFFC